MRKPIQEFDRTVCMACWSAFNNAAETDAAAFQLQ
jgi:hypothetical protein